MADASLRARLLGTFDVAIDGQPFERSAFERPSGLRLLKLLLATPDHRLRREEAAELLWPESEPDRSGANLRKAIHFLRAALPASAAGPVVLTDGDLLRLAPTLGLDVDVDRLRAALDRAARERELGDDVLEVVAELGGAPLLPEDPYEEWLVPLRDRLQQRVQGVLLQGVAAARHRGTRELATRLVGHALTLDPADEAAHRAAIEMLVESGHLHAARRQLAACSDALSETYGLTPSPDLERIIAAAASARPAVAATPRNDPEIIGRQRELEAIEAPLDTVASGRLGAILVRGEAGIGKTRLLREIVRTGMASGWQVLEIRGLEHAADTAFSSLGSALSLAVDGPTVDTWSEPGRSAALTIAPWPGAGALLEFTTEAALRAGVLDALRRLSRERPVLLAVDDVHWLDAATTGVLAAGLVGLADRPVLIAASLRDEPRETGAVDGFAADVVRVGGAELRLGPMGGREIERLLEREAGGRLAATAAEGIAGLAGGVPLYALELLREAVHAGALLERDGQLTLAQPKATLPIPRGVRQVVEQRTSGLEPDARGILAVAAELGNAITFELVAAASGATSQRVLEALDAGLVANLLVESGGGYVFGHPLFRAAFRGQVPRQDRARLHGRIAAALAGDVDPRDEAAIDAAIASGVDAVGIATAAAAAAELGDAAATTLAVGFGFGAGARQFALLDLAGAAETLRRALALWYRLSAGEQASFPAARAQMRLGLAYKAMADAAGAGEAFSAAAVVARTDDDRARAWAALSWLPYEHGEFDRSERILREGMGHVTDPAALAFLESGLGWILGRRGDWRAARELLARSASVLEPVAPPDLLARAIDRLAVSIRDTGEAAASLPVFERALRLAVESGVAHEEAMVRMHFAGGLLLVGEMDRARVELDRALGICALTGDRYIEAVTTWILAEVEDRAGNTAEAIRLREVELAILALIGNPQNQAMAHAHVAHLSRRLGNDTRAEAAAQEARRIAANAGIARLAEAVDRALAAPDWFSASHRTVGWDAGDATPGTTREQPGSMLAT
ncbi:MAG TPA: AAA family ATPase [Candidatus Limnocylindria bacterium]|nr:AAA family ATPase [Candidatus Limnocylindria bacterium]